MSFSELSDQELHLYSRHILLDGWDIDAQERLKKSHILVIGAGGLGCTSCELLVRAGVGKLTIIDFDDIEVSNLQRQIAFLPEHVGQSKVITLADHLKKMNPFVEIESISGKFDQGLIENLTEKYDLVLDGCDNFATRYLVNQFCVRQKIPLISASAIALEGQLLFLNGQACYQCIFPDDEVSDDRRCANSGVLTTTPVIMASLQAHHALLFLGLGLNPLLNKMLLWNGSTMQQRIIKIVSDPSCPICQHN